MKKVWLGLFVVVAAYACGDTASQMMGGALEDAGTMLQDAGEQMQDGGAQAQQSKSVTCDRTWTVRSAAGEVVYETKYALVDVGGKSFPDVSYKSVYPNTFACPDTATCTGAPSGETTGWNHVWEYFEGKALIRCSGNEESITIYY